MLEPVAMLKVHVLVLEKYVDGLTRALGDAGIVHLVDAVDQSRDRLLSHVDLAKDIAELERRHQRCRGLLDSLGLPLDPVTGDAELGLQQTDALLDEVEQAYRAEDDAINRLLTESGTLAREGSRLEAYPFRRIRFGTLRDLNHLYISTGRLSPAHLPDVVARLADRALILHDYDPHTREEQVLVLSSRRNQWAVESELAKGGLKSEELPAIPDTAEDEAHRVQGKLAAVRQDIEAHRAAVLTLAERYGMRLRAVYTQIGNALALRKAQQHFGKSARIYCMSGWIPRDMQAAVRETVEATTHGTAVLEFVRPDDDERVRRGAEMVPVKFRTVPWLAPFQALVSTFGAPRYEDVEPSLYVAVSFVLMFGLMFGDLGQGAVLAVAGLYMLRSKRPLVHRFRDAGYMLICCGLSAAVFGLLYGSIFGYEELLPEVPVLRHAVIVRPLHDVMVLFRAAIVLGIVFISGGILINIVNKFRSRRYMEGVLDKFGVIGIVFYWGSLGVGLRAAVAGELSLPGLAFLVILPLVILFLKEPLAALLSRKRRLVHHDPFAYVLEASIEIMETVTAFLGSTVSFVRLGGFALSHAALCMAIYAMVEVIRGLPFSGLWATVIVVLGNAFVILLEGMVAGIQGIRLQYYELFTKYFAGDGVLYSPFQLARSTKLKEEKQV